MVAHVAEPGAHVGEDEPSRRRSPSSRARISASQHVLQDLVVLRPGEPERLVESRRRSIACSMVSRALGQVLHDAKRLLRTRPRPRRTPSASLARSAGLAEIRRPLCSQTSPRGRGGPAARPARPDGRVEPLDRLDDPGVQLAARSWSRLPYATSWVSACLKVYSRSGNRLRLVQELGRLQTREAASQRLALAARRSPGAARTARPCRSRRPSGAAACPRGQPVDAGRQDRLDRGRHLDAPATGLVSR